MCVQEEDKRGERLHTLIQRARISQLSVCWRLSSVRTGATQSRIYVTRCTTKVRRNPCRTGYYRIWFLSWRSLSAKQSFFGIWALFRVPGRGSNVYGLFRHKPSHNRKYKRDISRVIYCNRLRRS